MPSCLGKTGKIKFENGIENNERNLHDNWKKNTMPLPINMIQDKKHLFKAMIMQKNALYNYIS